MTFLMARARGAPLVLLPVVIFARNPLPYLVRRSRDDAFGPAGLAGRRIGVRSYTTTTAVWTRGLLADACGVDLDRIGWTTLEDAHVADFADPGNVRRAAPGESLPGLLSRGDIDAAIVDPVPTEPAVVSVLADPNRAYLEWQERHDAITINHMVVVREGLSARYPAAVRELYRLFGESRDMSDPSIAPETAPMGFGACRRSLELAIDYADRQRLLDRRLCVGDLFDDRTAALG
jgi:4,5-dihydroxyphthalate decarboxylase